MVYKLKKFICLNCNKEFQKHYTKAKFCSSKCFGEERAKTGNFKEENHPKYGEPRLEITKKKIGEKNKINTKRLWQDEEYRNHMIEVHKGHKPSKETIEKMKITQGNRSKKTSKIGKKLFKEGKLPKCIGAKGKDNPMYGKKHNDNWKKERSLANSGKGNPFYGKKHTEKSLRKIGKLKLGKKFREKKFTKQEINQIINMYREVSGNKISKFFNCSYTPIYRILKENKIEIRRNKKVWDKQDEILELYNQKFPISKIASLINCDFCVIKRILRENNIKIKPQKEYMKGRISPRRLDLPEKEIVDMYVNQNISGSKITKYFNCSNVVIYGILKRNKIKVKENNFFLKGRHNSPKTEFKKGDPRISGKNNPNWNNGSSFEPYDQNWTPEFRKFIRKRDNQICLKCGIHREKLNRALSVHHINYNKKMSLPQNCCTLCLRCNSEVNRIKDREIWTKHFQELLFKLYNYQYSETGEIMLNLNQKEV